MASIMASAAPADDDSTSAPSTKSLNKGDHIWAQSNEAASTVTHRRMIVPVSRRRHHTITHNFANKDRSTYDENKHCQPVDSLVPLADELEEVPGITTKYLWVGFIPGDDPKKYRNKSSGVQRTDHSSSAPMDSIQTAMPLVMQLTEHMSNQCIFYVLCDPVPGPSVCRRRHAHKIGWENMSAFFFHEFLTSPQKVTLDMKATVAEQELKANLKYWAAISKTLPGGAGAQIVAGKLEKELSQKPLVVTDGQHHLALLNMYGKQLILTRDLRYLDLVEEICNKTAPGLTIFGPNTLDQGVQAFFGFDNEYLFGIDDAKQLIIELKTARPTMAQLDPRLVCRVRTVLSELPAVRGTVYRSGLPFFLELCSSSWPSPVLGDVETTQDELETLETAITVTKMHMRHSTVLTTNDERTSLPELGAMPDIIELVATIRDTLQARRRYEDLAMHNLNDQYGGALHYHDLESLMAQMSRVGDTDSFNTLQHQLGLLQAFSYSITTRKGAQKLDDELVKMTEGLLGALQINAK